MLPLIWVMSNHRQPAAQRLLTCLLLGLALALQLLPTTADSDLKALQLKHAIELEKAEAPLKKLHEGYLKHLSQIETSFQKAGDLDSVILVREIHEAAKDKPGAHAVPNKKLPPNLTKAISTYATELNKRQQAKAKQLLAFNKVYLKELVALRKQLTIANKTEDAITVAKIATQIQTEVEEGELHLRLDAGANVTGRFFSIVDDNANFYLNGKRVHRHPRAGNAASEPVSLKVGDCLFISARDLGSIEYLKAVFITADGKFVLSLNRQNTKVVPDGVQQRFVTPQQFASLTERAKLRHRQVPDGLAVENDAEWMWGPGNRHALLATIITADMFRKAFPKK